MSILDSFSEYMIPAQIVSYTETLNESTGVWGKAAVFGLAIYGIKYNRSEATRFFNKTWESNITDIFVTDQLNGITNGCTLLINNVYWKCDTPINVGEQNEVYTIGLELKV